MHECRRRDGTGPWVTGSVSARSVTVKLILIDYLVLYSQSILILIKVIPSQGEPSLYNYT